MLLNNVELDLKTKRKEGGVSQAGIAEKPGAMVSYAKNTRIPAFLLCILMALSLIMPLTAYAQESEQKVVRVGWYESPFNYTDQNGRRSGYAYEYQQRIAAYTGWEYEYVDASWPELLEMVKTGEIDLMSDVSYTEERAEEMLFSSFPMGAEQYYVPLSS